MPCNLNITILILYIFNDFYYYIYVFLPLNGMLNIVLFGPPGSGKGTQSENLTRSRSLIHISSGDLLRKNIDKGSAPGRKAQKYIDNGNLVPDEIVIEMVENKIRSHINCKGFIFDGFPRTVNQAGALDRMLKKHELDIAGMIALEVPDDELRSRIKKRAKTSGRSDDQDDEKINNRIEVYNKETAPVIDYYTIQNKFRAINGVGSVQEIFTKIEDVISAY